MNYLADRYAHYIVHRMLRLEEGEKLTVNADEESMEFSHKVAHEAAESTGVAVSLISIENGRVQSADEIEPSYPAREARGNVMLHLASFVTSEFREDEENDAVNLQKHRLLADPIFLDRRISIPWAVAYVPTASWAEYVYGSGATVDQLYIDLASYLGFDDEDEDFDSTRTLERSLAMRCMTLEKMKIKSLHLESPSLELNLYPASGAAISTSAVRLDSGRFFYPSLPCEDIIFPLDYRKGDGWFKSTLPFRFFDKSFQSVDVRIRDGRITGFESEDAKYVKRFLNIDDKSSALSELILCENLTRCADFPLSFGIPLLDRMRTSEIVFGGVSPEHITLKDEKELDSYGLNTSFARLEIPVGSRELCVTALLEDGREELIYEDGLFASEIQ